MSAARELVDTLMAPAMPVSRPRPTLVPTLVPRQRATQAPPTQRSVTHWEHGTTSTQMDAYDLLAVMRMNVEFLETMLARTASPDAVEAFHDLHSAIDRLERRFAAVVSTESPR